MSAKASNVKLTLKHVRKEVCKHWLLFLICRFLLNNYKDCVHDVLPYICFITVIWLALYIYVSYGLSSTLTSWTENGQFGEHIFCPLLFEYDKWPYQGPPPCYSHQTSTHGSVPFLICQLSEMHSMFNMTKWENVPKFVCFVYSWIMKGQVAWLSRL